LRSGTAIPEKIHGGIFFRAGGLAACRIAKAILAGIGGGTECVPEGYRPGGQAPESP